MRASVVVVNIMQHDLHTVKASRIASILVSPNLSTVLLMIQILHDPIPTILP